MSGVRDDLAPGRSANTWNGDRIGGEGGETQTTTPRSSGPHRHGQRLTTYNTLQLNETQPHFLYTSVRVERMEANNGPAGLEAWG